MDISLAETHEDLQTVYNNHALYHLAQQNPTSSGTEVGVALKPDLDGDIFTISETTLEHHTNGYEDEPSVQSINTFVDAANADKDLQTDTPAAKQEFGYFGSENSSFTLLNVSEEPSTIQFDESAAAVDELKHIGLTEKHLIKLANSTAVLPNAQDNEIQCQNHEILNIHPDVHPVELTKSVNDCDKPAQVPDATKVKVVDLMDSSSINELKRLWGKSGTGDKRARNPSTKSNPKRQKSIYTVKPEVRKHPKVKEKCKAVKCTTKADNRKIVDEILDRRKDLKLCLIKVNKVENLDFSRSDLKVDLTIPNSLKQYSGKGKPRTKLSKKTVQKVTNYVAKSVGLKSKKAKKEVTKFTMKAIKKVTKQIGKKKNVCAKQKAKDKEKRDTVSQTIESLNLIKQEKSENTECEDKVTLNENVIVNDVHGKNEENTIGDDLDFLCESSDDYVPSEDEYKPSKIKSLKDAFTKTNKRKKKTPMKSYPSKKCKLEAVPNENNTFSVNTKRKYVRRAFSTKRIGRPPVLGHFECRQCPFTATEKNLVDKHSRVHMRPVLPCHYCDATFRSENVLWEHEARKHTNEKPFKCQVEGCNYRSKCKTDLMKHQSKHATEKSYICQLCGWTTKWRRNLGSHHLMKHTEERKFHCPQCSYTCKRRSDLKQHMFRHTEDKPIKCLECGFQVKTNWELQSHMLSHSNEKPFKCTFPGCQQGTKTRADLNKHMRVHGTERNFMCEICSKGFKCQQSLNKHYPTHRDTRDFDCVTCGNKFKSKAALKKHLQLHTGIKPYKCKVCDMKFAVSNNLKSHMVTHDTTNRPFVCPLCPHAAKQQDHLLAHIGSFHRKSYTYFCEFCKKPFGRYGQLKIHYKRMHGEMDLSNLAQLDLAVLKMEMKLELEEASEKAKKKSKRSLKKNDRGKMEEIHTKEEPQDESYRDFVKDPGLEDVKSEEESGEIGRKISNQEDSVNTKIVTKSESEETVDRNPTVNEVDGKADEMSKKGHEQLNPEKQIDKNSEEVQDEPIVVNADDHEEVKGKESNIKDQSHIVCSSTTARLAVYDGFRLPLATKGFEFNYDKTGKKPRAWFMDVNLMNEKDSARQKKYLRRVGVLPPLPKGHRKKNSLLAFVNRRRRKLTERIRKSNLLKETKNATTGKGKRKTRFQGNYSEFETLAGAELTETDVTVKLVQDFKNVIPDGSEDEVKTEQLKKTSSVSENKIVKKASAVKTKSSRKYANVNKKQNNAMKRPAKAKPKLSSAAEKTVKMKKSKKHENKNASAPKRSKKLVKDKSGLQKAKVNGKAQSKSGKMASNERSGKTTSSKKDAAKIKNIVAKQASHKGKADRGDEKPKYNKMYVPVKKRKSTKGDKKTSKDNKTLKKKAEKKNIKPKVSTSSSKKRRLLKVKVTGSPHVRKVYHVPVSKETQNCLNSSQTVTSHLDHLSEEEPSIFPLKFQAHLEPPDEVKINHSEAALMNQWGVMLDRLIVLKTDVEVTENGDGNECDKYSTNDQTPLTSGDTDSEMSEEVGRGMITDKTVPDVSVKIEDNKLGDSPASPEYTRSYVIMDAETGKIKEALNVQMKTVDGSNEFNDSGIQVKLEPDDELE